MSEEKKYSLEELAELSGYSARTIRYYIAEKILPGPVTMGRGAEYSEEHLQRLQKVKELQNKGLSLLGVKHSLETGYPEPALSVAKTLLKEKLKESSTDPVIWEEVLIGGGVRVSMRVNETPERKEHIRKALGIFMEALNEKSDETKGIEGED